ncbi:MEDS domain-containing protein [Actinocrinis puniceicyclus]|uniref:MEDS domain-containing protein n=1 Tax=Actinocrinis puniceicyclus TaxID=977794 RepID=A0A8J8BE20_9ACTN|nr:MEDS domain-containing protein [Actinocrinis puniceicyclus]
MCWLVGSSEDYALGAETFAAQGKSLDERLLIVGRHPGGEHTRLGGAVVIDPVADGRLAANGPTAPWDFINRRINRRVGGMDVGAGRGGTLRVLAQMERLVPPGCGLNDLVELELGWGQWAASSGASVVCAYRQDAWQESILRDVSCVHSGQMGNRRLAVSFRMSYVAAGCWRVDGVIDFVAAPAFGTATRAALTRNGLVRLRFDGLDMIDAAGIQALAHAVRAVRGAKVRVEGANTTVRRLWQLSGFNTAAVAVEIA